jgi:cyanophycinase
MALCDPMTDPRGGAFTLGLGFVGPLAVIPAAETWSADRVHRTRKLARGFPLAELETAGALVRGPAGWERFGTVRLHLDGSEAGLDALPL